MVDSGPSASIRQSSASFDGCRELTTIAGARLSTPRSTEHFRRSSIQYPVPTSAVARRSTAKERQNQRQQDADDDRRRDREVETETAAAHHDVARQPAERDAEHH